MQMPIIGVVLRVRHLLLLAGSLVLAACGGQSDSVPAGEFTAPVVEFQLVFSDEFDGAELDESKWTIVEGDGCPELCGFGNNELQVYSRDNIEVSGGTLKITALDNPQLGAAAYTSGRINTRDKFEFRYGRVEFSARLPSGQGMWPALWMLHADESVYGPWPAGGEIDVMESFNPGVTGNTATQSTTHYGLPGAPFTGTSSQNDNGVPLDAAFHEYAVEWERDQLRFFVDGVHFQTQTSDEWYAYFPADEDGFFDPLGAYKLGPRDAPFDQLFYLIMNLAVGGNPVGPPEGTLFPQTLEVDYVRVFQCANANPDTGRGCGTGDVSVVPLEDNDGGPLEDVPTDNPYIERLDLFTDGPEALSLTTPDGTGTNQLFVSGFTGDGAEVINDPTFADPSDDTNTVWRVAISGGVANAFLASQDLSEDPILATGFDFSGFRTPGVGADPFGEIAFDMEIVSIDPNATILIKLDSGFPNLGQVALPATALAAPGVRKTYSVKFDQFLANPGFVDCCGGTGVDLANVINPFVIEVVGGAAEVYLDNIYVTNACKVVGGCGADLKSRGISDLVVFDDEVNLAVWSRGLVASDSGSGFQDYTDGTNPANKVNFSIVAAEDAERGNVIEATFNDSDAFGVFFVGSGAGVDVSTYGGGALVFDLRVTDYGTNTTGMTVKLDCFFPCTSGDRNLGVVADGVWETITLPLASLPTLDQTNVNTGIVIFPTAPQSGGITFQVDNVRFVADTGDAPPTFANLPLTFDDPTLTYSTVDFAGTSTVLGEDPADATNTVAITTKGDGAETFAGTVMIDPAFPEAIAFTADEQRMSVRVRAPAAGIPVLLKVETAADPNINAEVQVSTTVADDWEVLTWDFAGSGLDPNIAYDRAIIFFDFGSIGDGSVYYWENVQLGVPAAEPEGLALPITFDANGVDYPFGVFGGAETVLVADPANGDLQVAQTTKTAGAETFAGTVIGGFDSQLASAIPFAEGATTMNVRVQTPNAGTPVLLKLENADASSTTELLVNTSVGGAFETLTWNFADAPGFSLDVDYVRVVIFFDFGNPGDGATYLFDDVRFGAGGLSLPITFDASGVNYPFGVFGGAETTLVADPDNAELQVAQSIKTAGAETFAGTVIGGFDSSLATAIPFADGATSMSVRVQTPNAGTPVLLKLENADASSTTELLVNTTTGGAFETLTWDFSTAAGFSLDVDYVRVVIFFDFGNPGDGATYLFDDVQFGAGE